MKHMCIPKGIFNSNTYVVWDEATKDGCLIDAGVRPEYIKEIIVREGLRIPYILMTHCHFDHITYLQELKALTQAKIGIHPLDASGLLDPKINGSSFFEAPKAGVKEDFFIEEGDTLNIGSLELNFLHTPGHSAGGICIRVADSLFCGDTLFKGSYGRTDLATSDPAAMIRSVRDKLFQLPKETRIYPGHGDASTIGFEMQHNLILGLL